MEALAREHNLDRSQVNLARKFSAELCLRFWRTIEEVAEALNEAGELSRDDLFPLLADLPRINIDRRQARNPYDNNDRRSSLRTTLMGTLGADDDGEPRMRSASRARARA
jgi:hypothetical protein